MDLYQNTSRAYFTQLPHTAKHNMVCETATMTSLAAFLLDSSRVALYNPIPGTPCPPLSLILHPSITHDAHQSKHHFRLTATLQYLDQDLP